MNLVIEFELDFTATQIIPWQGYLRSNVINSAEYSLISQLDDYDNEGLYATKLSEYLGLFNKLLSNINKVDVVQWSLYHLLELLRNDCATRISQLTALNDINSNILQHLNNKDSFIHLASLKVLSLSLSVACSDQHLLTLLHSIHQDVEQGLHLEFTTLLLTHLVSIKLCKQYTYTHLLPHL